MKETARRVMLSRIRSELELAVKRSSEQRFFEACAHFALAASLLSQVKAWADAATFSSLCEQVGINSEVADHLMALSRGQGEVPAGTTINQLEA